MRRALVSVLAVALLLSVSGCGGDDDPPPKADKAESADTPTPSESSKAAAKEETKVQAKTIKDDVLGHTIKTVAIVRHFPFPESMSAVEERGDTELVLVNVTGTAGKKYFVSLADGDFRLSASADDPESAVPTSTVETEMTNAGYKPFDEVDQGKSGGGWIAFTVRDTTDAPLFLSYKRLEANNGDIPEKIVTVPLTPVG